MIPGDPLDSRLDTAAGELRSQLGEAPIPDFEPNKRVAAPVAAVVAILIGIGVFLSAPFSNNASQVDVADDTSIDAPDIDGDSGPVVPEPAPDSEVDSSDPSRRTTTELETAASDVELTFGQDATQPSSDRVRPDLGQLRNDPAYGSVITRLTDAGGRFSRFDSNRRVMTNSDNTLLITHVDDGTSENMSIIDLESLEQVAVVDRDEESELTWHPTDPARIRHLSGGDANNGSLRLLETDVTTGETSVLADLTDRIQQIFPTGTHMLSAHGRPGDNGNFWAWVVRDETGAPIGAVSYDLAADSIIGSLSELDPTASGQELPAIVDEGLVNGPGDIESILVTSDAKYVVIEYAFVTIVHDADFSAFRAIENTGDNADVVATPDGTDAYVFVNFNTPSQNYGFLTAVDLDTLEQTPLINLFDNANTSMSVSGTATGKPGWVALSTFSCKNEVGADEAWTCNKIMLMELGGENRIVPLAHTYRCSNDEDASWFTIPNGWTNRDLTRVYFTSDSGRCTEGGEIYEVIVPGQFAELN